MKEQIKTNVEVNQEVKEEMNKIIWSSGDTAKDSTVETENKVEETTTETTVPKSEVTDETTTEETKETSTEENKEVENKETENKETENKEAADSTETAEVTKKKRNISKFGDKEWASKISEDQKFDKNTIFCFRPDSIGKIGNFISYGKKEGIIWVDMFKKNSFDHMSKPWAVQIKECELVAETKDGVENVNPKYVKDDKGYHFATAEAKTESTEKVTEEVTEKDDKAAVTEDTVTTTETATVPTEDAKDSNEAAVTE